MSKRTLYLLSFILTIVIGTFIRFHKLADIPSGLQQDETSIGYNAYSILQTGKDEYGKKLPLYFKAFGEYKLPGYIYASVLPIKYFGMNAFGVRFASALSGSLTILLIFLLTKELFTNHKSRDSIALLSSFLLTLNPWHIHFSRGAFEVTLALFFITLGLYAFLLALKRKTFPPLVISCASFAASLYTYNISRLFIPLFGLTLLFLYRNQIHSLPRKFIYAIIALTALLLFPFARSVGGKGGVSATTGTLIFTSKAVQAPLIESRGMVNVSSPFLAKSVLNLPFMTTWQYVNNIASYLSVEYLFLTGSTHGNHGIATDGQFYLFQLPLVIIGIALLFKKPKSTTYVLVAWIVEIVLIASLTREAPQATRSFNLIIPLTILSSVGGVWLYERIQKLPKLRRNISLIVALIIIGYSVAHYLTSYFYRFPLAYAQQWNQADKGLVDYVRAHKDEYNHVVFDKRMPFPYTSLLFYLPYSPSTFQDNVRREKDDTEGFSKVDSFEKYQFVNIDWGNLSRNHDTHTLVVTSYQFLPKDISYTLLETIYFPEVPHVLSKDEQFFFFSEKKEAYVLLRVN